MDLVGADAHTDGLTGRAGAGGMDEPLAALTLHMHLEVDALEDDVIDDAHQLAFHRRDHFNIFGADDHLYALLPGKAAVHTGELDAREGDEKIAVHHAVHDVGVTDEVGHKGVLGLVVDVLGGADLLHLAAVHNDDGVGHGQGLFLVVGDIDEGDVHLALQALEFQLHLLAQLEVQGAQRLVEKQDLRLIDQAAGDGHALLLAAGHLADAAALEALQAHDFQHIPHLAADGLFVHLLEAEAEGHILKDVQVGEQRVFLEHGVHWTLVGRYACDVLSFQQHFAGRWFQKARDEAEGGGFTAAGGSQQRHKLFVMDVEVQPIQDALTIKFHYDVSQRNDH